MSGFGGPDYLQSGSHALRKTILYDANGNQLATIPTSLASLPADPLGLNADAVVAAGAVGSISAKLRRATQGLEDLKTLIVLAAGSAAIGKLAANSGVDIGDVDVLSLPILSAEGTLLASAARTATTASPDQTNNYHRGVIVWLNVTVAPGVETLITRIEGKDPIGGLYRTLNAAPTGITTAALFAYWLYPTDSTGQNLDQATEMPLPRTWRVNVVHSAGSSWTYSVGYSLIP